MLGVPHRTCWSYSIAREGVTQAHTWADGEAPTTVDGMVSVSTFRTLADVLREWSDDRLCGLLRMRPDLATPVPQDIAALASRAGTRASLSRAVERLDRFRLSVLEATVVAGEPVGQSRIAALLMAPEPRIVEAVDTLRALAIVWGHPEELHVLRAVHEVLGPEPAGLGPSASNLLRSYAPSKLTRLAQTMEVPVGGDPATTIRSIVNSWQQADRLDDLIADCGPDSRQVLARLTWGPPRGQLAPSSGDPTSRAAAVAVGRLLDRGLLVPVDRRTVVLPREIGLHLRGGRIVAGPVHQRPRPDLTRCDPALVDRTAGGAAFEFVRRIELLGEAWGQSPPPVLRGGGIGVRDLRRAASLLDVDEPLAALHIEMAHEAGLLAEGGDNEFDRVWLPTEAFDAWTVGAVVRRWVVLADSWLRMHRLVGLVGSRDERDRPLNALRTGLERAIAPDLRRVVLQVLADLPPGAAATPDAVSEVVAWERPRRGSLGESMVTWTLREAAAVGLTGLGALAVHGRAVLDGERDVAGLLEPLFPEQVDSVLIQADLSAVAPGPLESSVARDMALMADVESRGGATVYRFTAESILRALDFGWSATDLHEFLATRSRTLVPQPLSYLVDDMARRHGRVRVGVAGSYIRCDDDAVLTRVIADPGAAALRLRRIGPTVVVSEAPVDVVLSTLRDLGTAPVAEGADGTVNIWRHDSRRALGRPPRSDDPYGGLTESRLRSTVHALRSGERAVEARPHNAEPGRLPRTASIDMVARLREAAQARRSVWLGYLDQQGTASEQIVEPVSVGGGWLTAYDDRSGQVRTFAIHRISGVALLGAS
jgi:Helicase conserved C-terminal domain/WYL domain